MRAIFCKIFVIPAKTNPSPEAIVALAAFYPVLITLALLTASATVISALLDPKVAAGFGLIATGVGLMMLPLCAASPELERSITAIWAYTVLTATMTATSFCASVLESMDAAVQMVPVEDDAPFVSDLDPATAPAALSIRPLITRIRQINIHLPRQEHAHA